MQAMQNFKSENPVIHSNKSSDAHPDQRPSFGMTCRDIEDHVCCVQHLQCPVNSCLPPQYQRASGRCGVPHGGGPGPRGPVVRRHRGCSHC